MRNTTAFALALAATTLLACDTREVEDEPVIEPGQELPQTPEQPAGPTETMVSTSQFEAVGETPTAGAMPVSGTAELRRVRDDGSLELNVRLQGLPEGEHAWHIHEGSCGEQGAILVPLSEVQGREAVDDDLEVGSDGVVERRITIEAEHARTLDLSREYALNVHTGAGDTPGAPIACANIGGSTTGTTPQAPRN